MAPVDWLFIGIGVAFCAIIFLFYWFGDEDRVTDSLIFSVRWVMVGLIVGVVSSAYQQWNLTSAHFAYGMMGIVTLLFVEYSLSVADAIETEES